VEPLRGRETYGYWPNSKARGFTLALAIFVCCTAGCSVRQRMNQEFFKFHGVVDRTPAAAGLAYEDIDIRVESRTLKGWSFLLRIPENDRTAVLIFHGVGEVVSDWVSVIDYSPPTASRP